MIGQALVILDQIEATSRELIGQGGEVPSRKAEGFEHAADQGPVMSSNQVPQPCAAMSRPRPTREHGLRQVKTVYAKAGFEAGNTEDDVKELREIISHQLGRETHDGFMRRPCQRPKALDTPKDLFSEGPTGQELVRHLNGLLQAQGLSSGSRFRFGAGQTIFDAEAGVQCMVGFHRHHGWG